nr:MAG TPA: TerY-C metal binding domain [Bacteriophage sp.]
MRNCICGIERILTSNAGKHCGPMATCSCGKLLRGPRYLNENVNI